MQFHIQFIHPASGGRSHTLAGNPDDLLQMIWESRRKFHEAEKENNPDEFDPEKADQDFDSHVVLVLFEQPDTGEGFFSRRPPLTIPRFEVALSSLTNKEATA